jgi:NAD(P)-dependent dehydrogenase (short-subunit alcohol dehydrogenase family)
MQTLFTLLGDAADGVLIVTGASGGIAQALISAAAAAGHTVLAVSRKAESAPATNVHWLQADVSTADGARAALAAATALGVPKRLAHMAGNTLIAPIAKTSDEAYAQVMNANLNSAFFMLRAWVEALRGAQSTGSAVFASSVVAQIGVANHEAIASAKAGVEALVRSAAATYAAQGLRINAVAPGLTESPMTAGMLKSPPMREGAAKQYPLVGINTAEDVAQAVAFLLGPMSARINGQVLPVDGGFTAVRPMVR